MDYIRIPSIVEGASTTDTIRQQILYSGLPNQCRKCRKFGHHARICTVNKIKPQEGPTQPTQRNSHRGRLREARKIALDSDRRTPRKQSRTPPESFHRPSRNDENQSARGSKVLNGPPLCPRANNQPGHKAHRKHNVESKPLELDIHITKGPNHDRAHGVPNPRQAPQSNGC